MSPPTAPALPQPYCVYYPDPDQYFYLYQRYPDYPNLEVEVRKEFGCWWQCPTHTHTHTPRPVTLPRTDDPPHRQGVTNEHFIVWMRTAGLPSFRKLYGRIDQDIPAGTQLSFVINPGFEVVSFAGKKHLGACVRA